MKLVLIDGFEVELTSKGFWIGNDSKTNKALNDRIGVLKTLGRLGPADGFPRQLIFDDAVFMFDGLVLQDDETMPNNSRVTF